MKTTFILLFALISFFGVTQNVNKSKKTDPIVESQSKVAASPAYNLDGKIITNFDNLSPDNVFDVSFLKGAQDTVRFGKNAVNGVTLITSKRFAHREIEEKLGSFSKTYNRFISRKHICHITYILNDSIVPERTIFYLPIKKIKKVKFIASETNPEVKIRSGRFILPKANVEQIYIRGAKI